MAKCQIDAQMSEKYGKQMGNSEITNCPETKVSSDFFESQFVIIRMHF